MISGNGKPLAVGSKVTFDTWDDTDKANPKRTSTAGVVTALAGESRDNQTLGEVTIKYGKDKDTKEMTVAAFAVTDVK
ncbi:MAG: hypothetical protein QM813_09330 [Verrucomicrobiota bacterium]